MEFSFPKYTFLLLGCQNTPAKASRYCTQHRNTAMVFSNDGEEESAKIPSQAGDNTTSLAIEITNQKITRQGLIYELINFHS